MKLVVREENTPSQPNLRTWRDPQNSLLKSLLEVEGPAGMEKKMRAVFAELLSLLFAYAKRIDYDYNETEDADTSYSENIVLDFHMMVPVCRFKTSVTLKMEHYGDAKLQSYW